MVAGGDGTSVGGETDGTIVVGATAMATTGGSIGGGGGGDGGVTMIIRSGGTTTSVWQAVMCAPNWPSSSYISPQMSHLNAGNSMLW